MRTLPRVVPAEPGRPTRAGAEAVQAMSLALARDPSTWSADLADQTIRTYAGLAAGWNAERGGYRSAPLADALARGGPWPAGPCLEIGSGSGLLTPLLAEVWPGVVSLDLSVDMLRLSPGPARVRADASRLPFADGGVRVAVVADGPLFVGELVRVLAPDGVVIWSNALGTVAPHHIPVDVVHDLLAAATPGEAWSGLTADAGWGLWAVLRRPG